jgi:hypothetical protein
VGKSIAIKERSLGNQIFDRCIGGRGNKGDALFDGLPVLSDIPASPLLRQTVVTIRVLCKPGRYLLDKLRSEGVVIIQVGDQVSAGDR